jgi:hypothetical protein
LFRELAKAIDYLRSTFLDIVREGFLQLLSDLGGVTLVVGAEAFCGPTIWVSTVTTPTHVSFQPDFMACMVSFFKASLADDASRVFLAVFAFPCHISDVQSFSTHTTGARICLLKLFYSFFRVLRTEEEDAHICLQIDQVVRNL